MSSDIDQKDSVLKIVCYAIYPDVVAQLGPFVARQHGNFKRSFGQVIFYSVTDMVG